MFSTELFKQRRTKILSMMSDHSIAIIPTNPELMRNGTDHHFPFRPHSDFFYLTGFSEPEAIAVLLKHQNSTHYILFNRVRDPLMETWEGARAGQAGAVSDFAADEARPYADFAEDLIELIADVSMIYFPLGFSETLDQIVKNAISKARKHVRAGVNAPDTIQNIQSLIHPMRLIKDPEELNCMRKAAEISAQAHSRAMRVVRPGLYEYQIEGELAHEFSQHGSRFQAYPSIVAGGANACILHYVENNQILNAGELLLIDAGCEYHYYASDITRTFPIDGHWSSAQQAIYEAVLHVQLTCLKHIRAGVSFNSLQDVTVAAFTQALVDLKILQGDVNNLIESKAYSAFYMHRVSHWLGLDTHDMGGYKINGEWRNLAENMVMTVEPGLYFQPQKDLDEKWWNIGVRIEDDIAVTTTGCEILTAGVPKTISDIKHLQLGK